MTSQQDEVVDVVVVGSGPSGGVVTHTLAAQGFNAMRRHGPLTSRPGRVAATRTLCGKAGRSRSPAIRDGPLWMSSW